MKFVQDLSGYIDAFLDLEFLAGEPYSCFVYGSEERARAVSRLIMPRSEFGPPFGKLVVGDDGGVLGMAAYLRKDDLNARRLSAMMALSASGELRDKEILARAKLVSPTDIKCEEGDLYLSRFAVSPNVRRRGVGRWLLKQYEQEARGLQLRRLVLEVCPVHAEALQLYLRLGFVEIAEFAVGDPASDRTFVRKHLVKVLS